MMVLGCKVMGVYLRSFVGQTCQRSMSEWPTVSSSLTGADDIECLEVVVASAPPKCNPRGL